MSWIVLLIVHGLLAFLLLGAITHQTVSAMWPARRKRLFIESFAAVRTPFYANAVVVLFLCTFVLGAWIYTNYRTDVRPALEEVRALPAIGFFELKEHFLALILGLLPTYWLLWKRIPLAEQTRTRIAITLFIAVGSWWGFLVGHILNNTRGLGA